MIAWDWFFKRVEIRGDCWVWTGANDGGLGYGKIYRQGTQLKAHRVAWELYNGPIPGDLMVLHRCDNPPCVRRDHLFLGTLLENIQDRHRKGRSSRGEGRPGAVLSDKKVRMIRTFYIMGLHQTQIARGIGASASTIGEVIRGRSWKHVV